MAEDQQTTTITTTTESKASKPGFVLARIKPYNPRAGAKIRSYTYKGNRFREEAGWYRISTDLADELRNVYVDENDPYSPLVFDVLSEEEALAVEEREQKRRERASAVAPNQAPNLRNADARRAVRAAQNAQAALTSGREVRVTDAPNDESIPNGYPPARVYPMPQPIGTQTTVNYRDAPAIEEQTIGELLNNTAVVGASDKDVSVAGANIARDQQGVAPIVVDGQGTIDDGDNFNLEGTDIDFGPDNPEGEDKPAGPPSARRKKRGG